MRERLNAVLRTLVGRPAAVAVSGGIDSLTLATAAHSMLGAGVFMYHATSPAVPAEAMARTRAVAVAQGWTLDVFDAGEFSDEAYRVNPVNRCFFCKQSLYGAVARRIEAQLHGGQILSGTNLDDLGEYRPGLEAARAHGVRHPFVEAAIDKRGVRALAVAFGLGVLAELPAAPCLSSRVETGIRIEAPVLAMVHAVETLVSARLSPQTVRCRVRAAGIVIELDPAALAAVDRASSLRGDVEVLAAAAGLGGPVSFAAYRNGSAFLTKSGVAA